MDGECNVCAISTIRRRTIWRWKEKNYLIAREPGALATFDFTTLPPQFEPVRATVPDITMEGKNPSSQEGPHRFDPLPLGMRPGGPYNIHQVGVNDERDIRVEDKRQSALEEEDSHTGRVMIGYQRSATLNLGSVCCWVDGDRENGKVIDGWWDIRERNMGV